MISLYMLSPAQLLELFAVLCTVYGHFSGIIRVRNDFLQAQAKSGPVRPDTIPTGLLGSLPFSILQAVACFILPMIYIFTIVVAGFQQPPWMTAHALPEVAFGVSLENVWKNTARVLACLTAISVKGVATNVQDHLGDQYHPIGRREKPRVVQTGPYAWVRHPLYSIAISQTALLSLMFWSYAPLFASVAIAVIFSVKIPVEVLLVLAFGDVLMGIRQEEAILRDDGIREEYRAYMRKVPARLVPYVW